MEVPVIEIVPFETAHQPGIDLLYKAIEEEFPEQVFSNSPKTITELSRSGDRRYWVALANANVIGTVGIIILNDNCCALKSMFLAKEFRTDKRQIARQLLETAVNYAKKQEHNKICLGTMAQFTAAQRFYEKNGFTRTMQEDLPVGFPANPVDTVFYSKEL